MLEFYQAYANYHDLMDLTEELGEVRRDGSQRLADDRVQGTSIDLSQWNRYSMREAIIKLWPKRGWLRRWNIASPSDVRELAFRLLAADINMAHPDHIKADPANHFGQAIAAIFEAVAEDHLIQPTSSTTFPLAVSPLSKVKPDEPEWVERFEFYIGGFELGNAFSELNDPVDQERRFTQQLAERQRGDEEAHQPDEDYVRALAYGLPPTAGEGIGIDRLTMILTGARSIRDVILFPLMRPAKEDASQKDKES